MADGYAQLDAMVATLRKLGQAPTLVAAVAAPLVSAAAKATAAAGTDPYGVPWPPKKDGSRPLANAAAAVSAAAVAGTVVQLRLDGTATGSQKVQAIQHHGTGNIPARAMLPRGGEDLPKGIAAACQAAASKVFQQATAGGSK
jgi:hypothetical protein